MTDPASGGVLLAVLNDLIFETKIRTTAEDLNVRFVRTRNSSKISSIIDDNRPCLIIIDLNTLGSEGIDAVRTGCSHACKSFVLAFVAHVDERLAKEATAAGADQVVTRSYFSANLPKIIAEHCRDAG